MSLRYYLSVLSCTVLYSPVQAVKFNTDLQLKTCIIVRHCIDSSFLSFSPPCVSPCISSSVLVHLYHLLFLCHHHPFVLSIPFLRLIFSFSSFSYFFLLHHTHIVVLLTHPSLSPPPPPPPAFCLIHQIELMVKWFKAV